MGIVAIIIIIVVFLIGKFLFDSNTDNSSLGGMSADKKFKVVIDNINAEAFGGRASVIRTNNKVFSLYQDGKNQIVEFEFNSGALIITWKYKYFQKEIIHKKRFPNVENLNIFEQEKISKIMIEEMNEVINQHQLNTFNNL